MNTIDRSVGLLIMSEAILPGKTRSELVAVLQRRGEFDHEKRCLETWPGICQLTVHGRLKGNEDWESGLLREIEEELGEQFLSLFRRTLMSCLIKLTDSDDIESGRATKNYVVFSDVSFLNSVKLSASTGGLKFIGDGHTIKPTENSMKRKGVSDGTVVMFPSDAKAVSAAFRIYKRLQGH